MTQDSLTSILPIGGLVLPNMLKMLFGADLVRLGRISAPKEAERQAEEDPEDKRDRPCA
jgi:hypothetical protein